MDCREMSPYLEPYGDGELDMSERAAVEAHLGECLACQEQVSQHRRFRQLLRRQPRETAPPELRARAVQAIRAAALRRRERLHRLLPIGMRGRRAESG